jgi:hypothetical protein
MKAVVLLLMMLALTVAPVFALTNDVAWYERSASSESTPSGTYSDQIGMNWHLP